MRRLLLALVAPVALVAVSLGSAPAQAAERPGPKVEVVMGLSTKTLKPGGTVVITGIVTYTVASDKVRLEKRFGTGKWIVAGGAKLSGDGSFRIPETPTTTQDRAYRVCFVNVCSKPKKVHFVT